MKPADCRISIEERKAIDDYFGLENINSRRVRAGKVGWNCAWRIDNFVSYLRSVFKVFHNLQALHVLEPLKSNQNVAAQTMK
jgi:hypothetical protein